MAQRFGIEFKHHDALEDAQAAGMILLQAIDDSGMNIDALLERSTHKIRQHHAQTGILKVNYLVKLSSLRAHYHSIGALPQNLQVALVAR